MDTITRAADDEVRRMSYAEIAEWRGVSIGAARRLTQRHRWHKQIGNDGIVTVSVPATYVAERRKPVATTRRSATDATTVATTIRAFEKAIETLSEQLGMKDARIAALEAELAAARRSWWRRMW